MFVRLASLAAVVVLAAGARSTMPQAAADLDAATAARFAKLALACVQQEYPNKIAHTLASDADAQPPRKLTPSFYGCYDWHSSVHGHWLLARLARQFPSAPFAADARRALQTNLTATNIAGEVAYLNAAGRESCERPYGLAWLLQLGAELREWQTPEGRALSTALAPLESAVVLRLTAWLPNLVYPIREGEHPQTAFSFGLALDWARATGNRSLEDLLVMKTREFYQKDKNCPIDYEPSGQDFLSPCIAEADLMRRVLAPPEFATWLTTFLPRLPKTADSSWLPIGVVLNRADGKLGHLDGLNLSRAWMLEGIVAGLPANDARRAGLLATAKTHAESGLASVTGEHYEGAHWLGSFATYLLTRRGISK